MKGIWDFLTFWLTMRAKRDRIIADPERRERSVSFGVQSIASSLFGAAIIILCAFGISSLMSNDSPVAIVFIALLALVIVVALVQFTLRSLIAMLYQLKINKKPIGWVALALWIIALIVSVVVSILMLSKVLGA